MSTRNNRPKPQEAKVVEIIENPEVERLGQRFIPPIEPPDDDENEGEGGEDYDPLEDAIDDLRDDVQALTKEIAALSQTIERNSKASAVLVQSNAQLAGTLAAVSEKLGGLAGLGAIGKMFGK